MFKTNTSFPVTLLLEWVRLCLLLAVCGALLQSLAVRDVAQGVADITGDVNKDSYDRTVTKELSILQRL